MAARALLAGTLGWNQHYPSAAPLLLVLEAGGETRPRPDREWLDSDRTSVSRYGQDSLWCRPRSATSSVRAKGLLAVDFLVLPYLIGLAVLGRESENAREEPTQVGLKEAPCGMGQCEVASSFNLCSTGSIMLSLMEAITC